MRACVRACARTRVCVYVWTYACMCARACVCVWIWVLVEVFWSSCFPVTPDVVGSYRRTITAGPLTTGSYMNFLIRGRACRYYAGHLLPCCHHHHHRHHHRRLRHCLVGVITVHHYPAESSRVIAAVVTPCSSRKPGG